MSVKSIQQQLRALGNSDIAKHSAGFFKTGDGEYGAGDKFLGIRVPVLRQQAKKLRDTPLRTVIALLKSTYHEERLLALLMLVNHFQHGDEDTQQNIYELYLQHTRYINNWDLVDSSAHQIVGGWLADKNKAVLYELAKSEDLWERRIAIIATYHFIRQQQFSPTLKISRILLRDNEDLIHKAVGWMLREVGKRDLATEEDFLKQHYKKMPRTMLRYAIEKFPEKKRQSYLKG